MNQTHPLIMQVVESAKISGALRREIVTLCNRAYEEELETLFETLGDATHLLGYCDGVLVCHVLWVSRHLQAGSGPMMHTAYVELLATDPAYRNRGFAADIMRHLVGKIQDYTLAGLSPFSVDYYARLGWELWRGPLFIRVNESLLPSAADEDVMIFRLPKTPPLDLNAPLSAEWRDGELW